MAAAPERTRTEDVSVASDERVDFSALLLPEAILKGIRYVGALRILFELH